MSTPARPGKLFSNAASCAAALLVVAFALAAPVAAAATAEITSTPSSAGHYTPGGTPDEITVVVTFDAAVSVSGQPVFQLVVGQRTRNMAYREGSGSATLTFAYEVQDGDLDTDGVSYRANALRGGTITDLNDGTAVDRRVPALARDADHKVDGVAPRPVSVQVTSNPAMGGAYATGQDVVVTIRFDENLAASSDDSIELDFDGRRHTASRTDLTDNIATFTYTVVAGDLDTNGFAVPVNRLTLADTHGNEDERSTGALQTVQRIDGVAPEVSRAAIVSSAGGDQTYREGDRIEIDVTFSEPVRGAAGTTFAILVGTADAPIVLRAEYVSGENTSRVRYRYVVEAGASDPDGISFAANALTGTFTDRAGNALPPDAVPAVAEQANHKVDGGEDLDPPRVSQVAVTSQPERGGAYAFGQPIEVTVRFNETVVVTAPDELKLWLGVGGRSVQADFDIDSNSSARLRFEYTVQEGDFDSTGITVPPIAESLVGGTIRDPSGNTAIRAFARLPDQSAHRVDGVRPVVELAEIVSRPAAGDTYGVGEHIEVEVEFSEPVLAPDLGLLINFGLDVGTETRLAHLVSGEGTRRLLFRYRVQQDDNDDDGIAITETALTGSPAEDLAGNPAETAQPGLALGAQDAHKVDAQPTAAATVTVVSNAGNDEIYGRGDVIELDVTFAEDVVVTGTPELVLSFGDTEGRAPTKRRAQLVRVRPRVLTFRYEVGAGDEDSNGLSVDANALVGGNITDVNGNPARLLTALENVGAHKVDGIEPTPIGTEITSDPGPDDTYGLGAAIDLAVSFDEVVHAIEHPGDWVLRIVVGGNTREADLFAGSGTRTLHFRYIVQDEDRDADGISMNANGLVCVPEPAGCTMEDNAGNLVTAALQGLPAQPGHRVDGRRYEAVLAIVSTPARDAYGDGEHIDLTLAFPQTVFVLRGGDPSLPELALSIGGAEHRAAFNGGSGTSTLRFRYTVQGGDFDADGISVAAGPDSLLGGVIRDAQGDDVARNFDALPADARHRVDAVRARAVEVRIASSPAGTEYGLGETLRLEAEFDEVVYVTGGDELALLVGVGGETRRAAYTDGSGTETLVFEYRIGTEDRDEDGISVGPDAIVGGVIEDGAGNESEAAERRIPALPAQPGHKVNPDLDRVPPLVSAVAISSRPTDETYRAGETIAVDVSFDEFVYVSGEPTLEISIGAATRPAGYASGSGTATLTFRYVVQSDDRDTDGISIGPGTNSLTGGTISDGAGNEALREFEGLPVDPRHTVQAGLTPARVADVRIASPPGTYREGQSIDVEVEFTEVVHVGGEPALALSIGARDRAAAYFTGGGTDTLRFRYTVVDGDLDADGISIGANALTGGTITDPAGTAALLDFAAVPQQAKHTVDAVPAAVVRVSIVSGPGTYDAGDRIEVAVVFDEPVLVTDVPAVTLSVGAATRYAVFAGGGGTRVLDFVYVVDADDADDDGISVPANSLAGGTITDLAGNAAVRDFRGLPADPDHRVRTSLGIGPPAVVDVNITPPKERRDTYLLGEDIEIRVWFGRHVHVTGQPTVTLSVGAATRAAAFASGSGTPTLVFRYAVQAGDYDDDGVSIGAGALTGGSITDAAGNPAVRRFLAIEAHPGRKVDAVLPVVDVVRIASDPDSGDTYGRGEPIEVAVEFNDVVHVTGDPELELRIGANSRAAAFASGSGTDTLTFRYEVGNDDHDEDGISIRANALTGGVIEDTSGNAVDRRFPAIDRQDKHRVIADGIPPRVATLTIEPREEGYRLGEDIDIRVKFNEVVHVTGQPSVILSVGAETRAAAYATGSGTDTLTFRYTVQAGDYDDDGVSIGAGALTGGDIADGAGNAAERHFDAVPADGQPKVDGTVAAVPKDGVTVSPPDEGDTFRLGEDIEIRVKFDRDVHVTGQPTLALSIGTETRLAALVEGSGTTTLVFNYTVQAGDNDDDGLSIARGALTGGGIADAEGNPANRDLELPADQGYAVDGTVANGTVAVAPPGEGDTYRLGETIVIRVEFTEEVFVTGQPTLALSVGTETRLAALVSGSGTKTLVFHYTVQAGDQDDDGLSIPAGALAGGGITDEAGNAVNRDFELRADDAFPVDGTVANVDTVAATPPPDGRTTYRLGDTIVIHIEFSEKVFVTGQPTLALSVGAATRNATLVEGSGTTTLVFNYTVQAGDRDDDGLSIPAGALTGGGIADEAGNAVNRDFELRADDAFPVDGAVPSVHGVLISSEPGPDEIYTPGDVIVATVEFNEVVHVAGGPVLTLGIGANDRSAAYADGTGTKELHFSYAVVDGDFDSDGIGVAAGALTGGTIADASGNPVDRAFEAQQFPGHKVWPEIDLLLPPLALEVGRRETVNLTVALAAAGVVYGGGFTAASDAPQVADAGTAGGQLIVTPVSEGTATITATARRVPVTVVLPVVVAASAAEEAVLQHALAAVGRGLLSGAADTVGGRLENFARAPAGPGPARIGSAFDPSSSGYSLTSPRVPAASRNGRSPFSPGATGTTGDPFATWADSFAIPGSSGAGLGPARGRSAAAGWPGPMEFSIPLRGLANPTLGIGVWGGGDVQTFEGDPDEGAYDGRLTTVHLGVDAIGDGWIAGASVSRSQADVSYEFDADASGAGDLEADLTAVYPYVQWSPGEKSAFWAILGFGSGEAEARRDGGPAPAEPGELSMSLGLAGLRLELGGFAGLDFALRGAGGMVRLETETGLYAIQGIAAAVQRFRAGLEASWPVATGGGTLTPFIDLGGRWDGGDGATGSALEVLGGIRYRGSRGGFEVKGRTLAMHGAEGYSETGVAASLFLTPKASGRGLTLSLTPRRGRVAATSDLWRGTRPLPNRAETDAAWSFDGRIGYGFGLRAKQGTVTPFAETATGAHGDRLRLGVGYESASSARSLRAELSAERHEPVGTRIEHGFRLMIEARF